MSVELLGFWQLKWLLTPKKKKVLFYLFIIVLFILLNFDKTVIENKNRNRKYYDKLLGTP